MSRERYMDAAIRAAHAAGIDPNLFMALIHQESRWDPTAVSPVGAFGLTQVMPATARQPGFGVRPMRDRSIEEQLRFGADYFAAMLDRYNGNIPRALAAYNAGHGVGDAWSGANIADLPATETQNYVRKITDAVGLPATATMSNREYKRRRRRVAPKPSDGGISEGDRQMGLYAQRPNRGPDGGISEGDRQMGLYAQGAPLDGPMRPLRRPDDLGPPERAGLGGVLEGLAGGEEEQQQRETIVTRAADLAAYESARQAALQGIGQRYAEELGLLRPRPRWLR